MLLQEDVLLSKFYGIYLINDLFEVMYFFKWQIENFGGYQIHLNIFIIKGFENVLFFFFH